MCGILGFFSSNKGISSDKEESFNKALNLLHHRGPNYQQSIINPNGILGHARLAIIDLNKSSNQPFSDTSENFSIVFNGEIYNYLEIRKKLELKGVKFKTSSDTEVLLHSYIQYGDDCIDLLNGFFAFAIYNKKEETIFVARDRFGIKPLMYIFDDEKFIFASELKPILKLLHNKAIDLEALSSFIKYSYIPAPKTMVKNINKLLPGEKLNIDLKNWKLNKLLYYSLDKKLLHQYPLQINYEEAQNNLIKKIDNSISKRLTSDVPIGTFLSGGIDSSVISYSAKKLNGNINTYSIGFKDIPFLDESLMAEKTAKKIESKHTTIKLSEKDLKFSAEEYLKIVDEPFSDSSGIAVHLLTKYVKKHITVALSGDGADEIFSGYNKHQALYESFKTNPKNLVLKNTNKLWKNLPKSRYSKYGNVLRKVEKYSKGLKLSPTERYWLWASFNNNQNILKDPKKDFFKHKIIDSNNFNTVLYNDTDFVLPNDMLKKADLFSMSNSLELRTPFLDHELVEYVFKLPVNYKIDKYQRKKILRDAYKQYLPEELFNAPKKGFEVPLHSMLKGDLFDLLEDYVFNEQDISSQNFFNFNEIKKLKITLLSSSPNDSAIQLWSLLVFQYWYKNTFTNA